MGRTDKKNRRSEQRTKKKGDKGGIVDPEEEFKGAPHTFIIKRGSVGKNVTRLIKDMRRVMEPFTASHLKTTKKNVLKDFVNVAGVLNVSHMMLFTKTENGTNLRIVRTPRGPTLTFHVEHYTLSSDVVSSLRRPNMEARQFLHHPLLVMNNFSGEGKEMALMSTMFQNMFPSINVNKVKLNSIRRCVLLNYNSEDKTVEFRHYNIKVVPVGMSRGVKKLIKAKVPNLDRFDDVSEFLLRGGELSESEAELDGPHNEVVLPQEVGSRGNIKSSKSAIRLTEIGPRLKLTLVKVEEGVCDGAILYHHYRHLSSEDIQYMMTKRKIKKEAKDQRKNLQLLNVKKKEAEKERLKQLSLEGMKKKVESLKSSQDSEGSDEEQNETQDKDKDSDSDDDVAYYKAEVGEEPDAEMKIGMKRKNYGRKSQPIRKRKRVDKTDTEGKLKTQQKFQKGQNRENSNQTGKLQKQYKKGQFGNSDRFDKPGEFHKDKFGKQNKFNKRGKFDKGKGFKAGRGQKVGRKPNAKARRGRR